MHSPRSDNSGESVLRRRAEKRNDRAAAHPLWRDFLAYHTSQEFFADIVRVGQRHSVTLSPPRP